MCIEDDWLHDSSDGIGLSYIAFGDALFQVADMWVAQIGASAYAAFLWRLFQDMTYGPRFKEWWRDLQCCRFDASLEQYASAGAVQSASERDLQRPVSERETQRPVSERDTHHAGHCARDDEAQKVNRCVSAAQGGGLDHHPGEFRSHGEASHGQSHVSASPHSGNNAIGNSSTDMAKHHQSDDGRSGGLTSTHALVRSSQCRRQAAKKIQAFHRGERARFERRERSEAVAIIQARSRGKLSRDRLTRQMSAQAQVPTGVPTSVQMAMQEGCAAARAWPSMTRPSMHELLRSGLRIRPRLRGESRWGNTSSARNLPRGFTIQPQESTSIVVRNCLGFLESLETKHDVLCMQHSAQIERMQTSRSPSAPTTSGSLLSPRGVTPITSPTLQLHPRGTKPANSIFPSWHGAHTAPSQSARDSGAVAMASPHRLGVASFDLHIERPGTAGRVGWGKMNRADSRGVRRRRAV